MAKITSKIPLYTTSFLVLFLAIVPFTFAYTEISKSAMVNNIVTFTPSGSYPNNKANPQYNFDSDVGLGKRTGWEQSGGDGYAQKYYHYYFNGSGKAIARWQYYGINNNSVGGGLYIQYSDDNITWTNATGLYAWQTGYRNITVSSPSVHNHWRIGVKPTHTFGNYYDLSLSEQWFFEESPEVWLVPYQYRLAIDCSSLDQNQPFLINGTQGFYIDGYHQLIWTRCIDDLYLYYNDHTDYLIGTETTRIGQEVELGTGTSYNVTDVWNSDYSAVYHLTETGSTYYDSTSNDNDGTLTGSPNQNVSCVIAGCVDIQQSDGDDYITVPDSASLDLTDVTIEAWVQIESPTGYGDSPIVIKGDIFGMNYHFGVTDSDGTLQVNDAGALHKSDTGQNQDQFYYVAMTRNSTKVYYFRNETTDGEDTVNVGSTNNDNLYIGFDGDSGTYGGRYDGKLDEVRVLNNNKDSSYFYKNYQNYQTVSSYGTVEDFQINTADLTPPTITINAPINNSLIKQRVFINLTIDELGDCTIYNNQFYIYSENQTFFSFYDYNLSNDAHSINIKCNDTTGNNAYSNINFSKLDDYADPIITYNFPTDTTGIKFNINMWINITTNETANCFLDSVNFTETNNFTLYYDDGLFHSWNEDNLTNGNYTININCSDPSDNSVLETIYFYKDIVSPAIVFNTPQNLEEVENTGLLSLNIDISDDSDLYNFKINISDNTTVYFNDIVNISGLEYNYLTNVNLENFTNSSDYRIMARACDSHTKNELKKIYQIIDKSDGITFQIDDILIEITDIDDNVKKSKHEKKKDRYTFGFEHKNKQDTYTYLLTANKPLNYLPLSKYLGHFIVNDLWIDFENPYNTVISPHETLPNTYYITIQGDYQEINFNSIGELNCNEEEITFTLIPTRELYNLNLISGNLFNNSIFNDSIPGMLAYFFVFIILVACAVLSIVMDIPGFYLLTAIGLFFYGILLFASISAIIGILVITIGVIFGIVGVRE